MRLYFSIIVLLVTYGITACTHKPFVPHTPAAPVDSCDTLHVSYARDIKPIILANCYSCHGTVVTDSGGLDLETFSSLKNYLTYGFRGDGLYGSKFWHCITHSLLALPMPPTYVIDSCSLKQIKHWIDNGAPEN